MTPRILWTTLLAALAVVTACKKNDSSPRSEDTAQAQTEGTTTAAEAPATSESDAPAADTEPAADADRIQKPFLWQVTKDDRKGYLLGTMHMGVDAEKKFPSIVWDALASTDSFCAEADIKDPRLIRATMRQDGGNLEEDLGAELWNKFKAIVGDRMAAGARSMKVSMAAAMLAMKGMPMTPPMDLIMETKAKGQGKSIHYLEDGLFQAGLLDKYLDVKALSYMIENHKELEAMSPKMLEAYLAGDADAMDRLMNDEEQWKASGGADAQEALLYKRNEDWIPKYEKMLADGMPFCAVGAGHLVGERSVIELLEKRGWKVERLGVGSKLPE